MLFSTDDMDDFIQIEESNQQTVQQVQTGQDLIQAVLQAATHRGNTEPQPLTQHAPEILHRRLAVSTDDVHVDPVAVLQIGGRKQMLHQIVQIDPVGARNNDDTRRVFVIGFIAQIGDHRQLLVLHLRGNLLQHLGARHLMRQRSNHDLTVFLAPHRTTAHRAAAAGVHLQQVFPRGDDLGFSGEVRPLNMLQNLVQSGTRIVQQTNTGRSHFFQVMRRDIGRHTDRNTSRSVKQQIGQARRQNHGFFHGTVEVRLPINRALSQLG